MHIVWKIRKEETGECAIAESLIVFLL